jgi:GTP-binding protein Era
MAGLDAGAGGSAAGAGAGGFAVAAALAAGGLDADVCARLVDESEMRRLNREFRGVDSATDVLSFPMAGDGLETDPQTGRAILGDIAVSPARAREQADEYGHPYSRELAFLTVHGVLHLMGCDHGTPQGEKAMEALQERALAAVGQARAEAGSRNEAAEAGKTCGADKAGAESAGGDHAAEATAVAEAAKCAETIGASGAAETAGTDGTATTAEAAETIGASETAEATVAAEAVEAAKGAETIGASDAAETAGAAESAEVAVAAEAAENAEAAVAERAEAAAPPAGEPRPAFGAAPGWAGYRAGFACLAGRPNTGKSTLLNRLTGEKLAIVSSKPQTTRKNIKAMLSSDDCQIIFIDTPGAHPPKNKLGEHMMRSVRAAVRDVDLILLLVDARSRDFDGQDLELLKLSKGSRIPVVLLINKADLVQKDSLLPLIGRLSAQHAFEAVIPISARTGDGLDRILPEIRRLLPEGPPLYPTDAVTDQTERQMAADVVREKALLLLDEEVPHGIETEVERFAPNASGTALEIYAVLYCEKESHKKIIIGKNGESLKKIGAAARLDLERACGRKVFLSLWVKLKKDWRNDAAALRHMGYGRDAGGGG